MRTDINFAAALNAKQSTYRRYNVPYKDLNDLPEPVREHLPKTRPGDLASGLQQRL